jgi:ABC-2 type transport system permease protein
MHLLQRALRDRRTPLLWWSFGVVLYCAMIIAVWPVIEGNSEFVEIYAEMPEALQAMFGPDGFSDFTSPTGFLNGYLFSMILPFIFTGLAVSLGSSLIGGEDEDGILDLVLSYPISRRRLVLEKALALILGLCMIGVVTVLVLTIGKEPVGLDVGVGGIAAATLGSVLFALVFGLVAFMAGAWRGARGFAMGVGWGVALGGYLLNVLANLDDSLDWLAPFSPLSWATSGSPVNGDLPAGYLALVATSVALLVATLFVFERHDLT